MRELLKNYELDKEVINSIMAEHGKSINGYIEQINDLKTINIELKEKNQKYEKEIGDLKTNNHNADEVQKELDALKKSVAERDEKEANEKKDAETLKKINEAIGEKKFINEYTKKSIINEIKTALNDEANVGKTAKDLFDTITKDKENVFVNENQFKDMPGVGNDTSDKSTKSDGIKLNPLFRNYN